jgi:serine/threonine-protein kinase
LRFDPGEREIIRIMFLAPRTARRVAPLALFTVALLVRAGGAQPAGDETQRRAVAQALFDEAQKLMESNSFSLACIKLEEVVRLQPGKIGAMLALARCYEGEGKTASAWSRFNNVADAAKVAGDARETEARKKVGELEKRLPRLSIVVRETTAALPGLSVKRDGVEVSAAQWGIAIPMDPGGHHIEVSAPGRTTWTDEAALTEGRTTTVSVPELAPEASPEPTATATASATAAPTARPAATVTATATATARATARATAAPREASSGGTFLGLTGKKWGLVAGGAGLVGLLVGGVSGGLAIGQHDALVKACGGGHCPPSRRSDIDGYETLGAVSTAGFVVGGVLAAAGAGLWFFWPPPKPAASAGVTPYVTLGGAGISGRF